MSNEEDNTPCIVIFGQSWVNQDFFELFYAKKIADYFAAGAQFFVGHEDGVPKMAQKRLVELCDASDNPGDIDRITVVVPLSVPLERIQACRADERLFIEGHGDTAIDRDDWMVGATTKTLVYLSPLEGGTSECMVSVLCSTGIVLQEAKSLAALITKAHTREDERFLSALRAAANAYYHIERKKTMVEKVGASPAASCAKSIEAPAAGLSVSSNHKNLQSTAASQLLTASCNMTYVGEGGIFDLEDD
jgi:hypothetical protein